MRDGCSAIDAGVCRGDRVLKVDGEAIHSADDLKAACEGKEVIEMVVSVERDGGMGGGDTGWAGGEEAADCSWRPHDGMAAASDDAAHAAGKRATNNTATMADRLGGSNCCPRRRHASVA